MSAFSHGRLAGLYEFEIPFGDEFRDGNAAGKYSEAVDADEAATEQRASAEASREAASNGSI